MASCGVGPQVAPLAVDRDDVARAGHVEHVEQLAGRRVAAHVNLRDVLVDHPGAPAGEPVDHPVDGVLVAGDEARRQHDGVAGLDPHRVVAVGHPRQRRQRLALRTGRDHADVLVGQRVDLASVDDQAGRHPQQPEIAGDAHVAHHRPADEGHRALVRLRRVEHLLHPVDVAGEAGDDDPPLGGAEHVVEHRRDLALAGDEAGNLGVGRVRQQQIDALAPEPGEAAEVGDAPVERELVHLEVAGVQDGARRRADGRRASASGIEWLTAKNSHSNGPKLALPSSMTSSISRLHPVLGELGPQQRQGEAAADHEQVRTLAQQERHRADVVLVRVGEDDGLDVAEPIADGAEVRQDQIDARAGRTPGRARRSRRSAAGRRARRRSYCDRSRRGRRARRSAGRPRPAARVRSDPDADGSCGQLQAGRRAVGAQDLDLLGGRVDERQPHRTGRQAQTAAAPPWS